jgi:transcriptional regulator with XRE-family HTH domain
MSISNLNSSYHYSVPWQTANAPSEIAQLPVDVSSRPIQVIGLRGRQLLKEILIYYDWTSEDLQRQIDQTQPQPEGFSLSTIAAWKSSGKISWRAAKVLGSLFGLEAHLFCCDSKLQKTCQAWDPPLFQKQERPSSESVQQILDSVRKRFQQGLPDDLVGLRGGSLLRKIRIAYLGWEREELKRQIEQNGHTSFAVSTINGWESGNNISVRAAHIFGSLFGIDPGLFNPQAGTSAQLPIEIPPAPVQVPCPSPLPTSRSTFQQRAFLPSPERERTTERISYAARKHLQEGAPQTSFSLVQREESTQSLSAESWKKPDNELFSFEEELDLFAGFDLCEGSSSTQDKPSSEKMSPLRAVPRDDEREAWQKLDDELFSFSEDSLVYLDDQLEKEPDPVKGSPAPVQMGFRGGSLIKMLRISRGWTQRELCKQIEETQRIQYAPHVEQSQNVSYHRTYEEKTIENWESGWNPISLPISKILSILFGGGIDPQLFCEHSKKTSQPSTLRSLQERVSKKRKK